MRDKYRLNKKRRILKSPKCNSSNYLMIWTILVSIIFLIIDIIIENKINLTIYKIYNNKRYQNKYNLNEFIEIIYSIIGYNKNWKYYKFLIEIIFLPTSVNLYNKFCTTNYEIINWLFLGTSVIVFISKISTIMGLEYDIKNKFY